MAPSGRSRYAEAARLARRGIPIALDLYRRWQELTPEQRERYLKTAREYAKKAGDAYADRRGKQGPKGGGSRPKGGGSGRGRPKRRRST